MNTATDKTDNQEPKTARLRWLLIAAICLSAATGLVMGLLRYSGLDSSAILYIGVPTIIALGMTQLSPCQSAIGATLKAITFVILISGPLLQEGFICMVMAAPILYIVGALAAWPFDHYRKKREAAENASSLNVMIIPALLILLSLEGVTEATSFNRYNVVERSVTIQADVTEIKSRLGARKQISAPDSYLGKLFPRPVTIDAEGLEVGDEHWTVLRYAKWVFWNEDVGSVRFSVAENKPNYIKFNPIADTSYLRNYLSWGLTEVVLDPISGNETRVTWRIHYHRNLDPAWYMHPLQSYMTGVAAEMLLTSLQ